MERVVLMTKQEMINFILTVCVIPLLGAVAAYLINFLKVKAAQLHQVFADNMYQKYIDIAIDIISSAVMTVNQTFVDELKKGGEFTKERQQEAFNKCKTIIFSMLSEEVKKVISLLYGDLDRWIDTKIEAFVNMSKKA